MVNAPPQAAVGSHDLVGVESWWEWFISDASGPRTEPGGTPGRSGSGRSWLRPFSKPSARGGRKPAPREPEFTSLSCSGSTLAMLTGVSSSPRRPLPIRPVLCGWLSAVAGASPNRGQGRLFTGTPTTPDCTCPCSQMKPVRQPFEAPLGGYFLSFSLAAYATSGHIFSFFSSFVTTNLPLT